LLQKWDRLCGENLGRKAVNKFSEGIKGTYTNVKITVKL
jgi:hypothetical protein